MAFDEALADRIRKVLGRKKGITEKLMFGGIAFLLRGKMFCGVNGDDLMLRVGPDAYAAALKRAHVRPMDFTGKPLKGYVYVGSGGRRGAALGKWITLATDFVATL